jgi:hypothetical protein
MLNLLPPHLCFFPSHPQGTAAKSGGLLNTLLKVAPWKITGPASGPEWKEVPLRADEYRVVAPGSVCNEWPLSPTHITIHSACGSPSD